MLYLCFRQARRCRYSNSSGIGSRKYLRSDCLSGVEASRQGLEDDSLRHLGLEFDEVHYFTGIVDWERACKLIIYGVTRCQERGIEEVLQLSIFPSQRGTFESETFFSNMQVQMQSRLQQSAQ